MTRLLLLFPLFIFLPLVCSAQTIITGKVASANGKPVQAFVSLSAKGSETTENYTDADERGLYKIEYRGEADSLALTVSGMGFGSITRMVANRSQAVDFTVAEKGYTLREVVVKAQKIREEGDTLNYNVAAYRDQTDRVIGDVLKKMPGIEVSESGGIKFNGKPIKNFYVENMDLLQSRYGIATNNISAEDVTVVQVMQNHQPIRAIKDLKPSEDVAINLKLRQQAKGTIILTGMAGVGEAGHGHGDRLLLAAELTGMYFGKWQQDLTLYKGNNTGNDIAQEFKQQTGGSGLLYGRSPLSVLAPSQPGIARKRYMQNRSHVVSVNHIAKIDSTKDLTVNVVYQRDRLRRWGESVSDYYLTSGERMVINETACSMEHTHHLDGAARYKANKANTYVSNSLSVNAGWDSADVLGTMNSTHAPSSTIGQHLKSPQLTISNDLYFLRNLGKTSCYVSFKAGYNQKPYRLSCDTLSQDYTVRTLAANVRTGYGWKWGKFKLDYLLYGDVNVQKSKISPLLSVESKEDYWNNRYSVGVEQYMHLDLARWFFSLNMPLSLETQHLDDNMYGQARTWSNVFLRPSAEIKYVMGPSWLTLTTRYYHLVDNNARAGRNLVMHNYRTFQRNAVEEAVRQRTLGSMLQFYHKNAYRQFFLNGSAAWLHVHSNNMTGVDYDGTETIYKTVAMPNDYDNYRFNMEISKGFDFWRSTVKLVGNCNITHSRRLIQEQPTNVRSRYWSTSTCLFVTPLGWLSMAAAYAYGQSRSHVGGSGGGRNISSSTARIDLNILPMKMLTLNFAIEDNYNNLTQADRHCWFGDAKATFKTKGLDYEITASNLFNRKAYTRASYSDLNLFTSTSFMRPRNIMATIRFKWL